MKAFKATLFALAFLSPVVLGNALIHAQSPGEDFEWVATTPGGIRIGASGNEGEEPTEDTLEFTGGCGKLWFQGEGGALSPKSLVVGAIELHNGYYEGGTVTLIAEPEGEDEVTSALMCAGGPAGMASVVVDGYFYGTEVQSGITCTPDGDVIVDLGGPAGDSMQQSAQTEEQSEAKDPAPFLRVIDWLGRKSSQ